jgi:hypothetical protein
MPGGMQTLSAESAKMTLQSIKNNELPQTIIAISFLL